MKDKILFPDEHIIVTKLFDVHQDWEVPIRGFFVIAPLRKVRSISEFTDGETEEFIRLVREVRKGMKEVLGIEDVYLFQNEDTKYNFHLRMFPRYKWMEEFGRKIQSVRPIVNYAKENMSGDKFLEEVRDAVKKMRARFLKFKF